MQGNVDIIKDGEVVANLEVTMAAGSGDGMGWEDPQNGMRPAALEMLD